MSKRIFTFAALAGLGFAFPVLAHSGGGAPTLVNGLGHPLSGADHMLAMIAVGLWAALRGGRAQWAWPAAFVVTMLIGLPLGQSLPDVLAAEPMILASVIILGSLIAADARAPTAAGMALIGVFGLAHGYAHGAESPAADLSFQFGLAISTIGLHFAGLGLGGLQRPMLARFLGVGAAGAGLAMAAF